MYCPSNRFTVGPFHFIWFLLFTHFSLLAVEDFITHFFNLSLKKLRIPSRTRTIKNIELQENSIKENITPSKEHNNLRLRGSKIKVIESVG